MTRQAISYVFLALFPLCEVACYGHLYWKRKDILIRKRNQSAICVASLAGWLAYFNLIVSLFGGIPCGAFYVASLLVAPVSVGPQVIRAVALRGTIKHSQLVTEEEISSRANRKSRLSTIPSGGAIEKDDSSSPYAMTKLMEAKLVMEHTRIIVRRTKWALLAFPSMLLVLALSLSSGDEQMLGTDFEQCHPEPTHIQYASPTLIGVSTVLALVATALVDKTDDEIGLKREIQRNTVFLACTNFVLIIARYSGYYEWLPLLQTMQQLLLLFSMSIVPFMRSRLNSMAMWAKKRINPATKSAVPGYAQSLPKRVSTRGSTRTSIQNILGRSGNQNDQRDREVSVSWDAGLCILLSTEEGINLFIQHCAREFSSENVRFWCAVNDYKARFDDEKCVPPSTGLDDENPSRTSQTDDANEDFDAAALAKEIYDEFIANSSRTQVNLSSKQKGDIKVAIDSGQLKREIYDAAQREIFAVMSRDSYPRFLASKQNRRHTM
ncbi:hypothetical protein ACHAWF_014087 [Thalassiosira exigua]